MSHSQRPLTFSRNALAKETGLNPRHITRLAQAGEIPGTESLSRTHYSRAFPIHDSVKLRRWLELEKAKKRRARPKINRSGTPIDHGRKGLVGPLVTSIQLAMHRMDKSGTLDKASADQLYNLHRDLLPVLKMHAGIIRRLSRSGDMDAMRLVKNDLTAIHR